MDMYGMSKDESEQAIRFFHEYYDEKGLFENRPYDGVEDMLHTLYAHGKKLMIATAKAQTIAERVADHFGLSQYLCNIKVTNADFVAEGDGIRATKEDVINYILKTNDILDPENAVMVGDRGSDIAAARKFGLQTIGAAYGYGSREELTAAEPDYIAEDPMQLIEIIVQS